MKRHMFSFVLALLFLGAVVSDSSAQITASYLEVIDAEGAQPDGDYGTGTVFVADVPVDFRLGATFWSRVLSTKCVAHNWTATFSEGGNFAAGEFSFRSACGDSIYSNNYVFDPYVNDTTASRLYGYQLPLEVAVGEEVGIAAGAEIHVLNNLSITGDVNLGYGWIPVSNKEALHNAVREIGEIVTKEDRPIVAWLSTGFLDKYYWYSVEEGGNEFEVGSAECRNWAPEVTAGIAALYEQGVMFVAGSGWSVSLADSVQTYPACLEEVMGVTLAEPELPHELWYSENGATLSASRYVELEYPQGPVVFSSTAIAPAMVAGAASAVRGVNPKLTPAEVEKILEECGIPNGMHRGFESRFLQVECSTEMARTYVATEDLPDFASSFSLEVFPNPYRGGDVLNVKVKGMLVPEREEVVVYDLLGREVARVREEVTALDLPSGTYFLVHRRSGATGRLIVFRN